ncbi:DUF5063 domain-containing protein [uncultured Nocardioides sp.]|uniref:DUF5063 domain-containing protein n=1 Tax=uncultured Nocardioides sp. TaxID=198441 RepID=UPI0025DC8001|nr:DUF5063 domain-containing protein [uncultured Nocardioides sp.]
MTDITDTGLEEFAGQIKDQVESFLLAVRAIAVEADGPRSISLLLLEMSQISLAGARLGAQVDFDPEGEYQPDVGPELDLDDVRLRLADILGEIDTYSFVFDPYLPEVVESQLSDDIISIATDLENGMRHYNAGHISEALWWWQFSYVSSWGNLAGAALNALWSVVSHDRLDAEFTGEDEVVAVANEMLEGVDPAAR